MVKADSGYPSGRAAGDVALDWNDPLYAEAVTDLLGMLAYGEFRAFEKLSADAAMAPGMGDRAAVAAMAVAEYGHFRRLCSALEAHGRNAFTAMAPFEAAIDSFHRNTQPTDWLEGLIKAYVGDGIAMDFYRGVAEFLDPETRSLVVSVCDDLGHSAFVIEAVAAATAADPSISGRLALWGRRLVGEAFARAQGVALERENLARLALAGGTSRPDLDALFERVTDAHVERMRELGLEA